MVSTTRKRERRLSVRKSASPVPQVRENSHIVGMMKPFAKDVKMSSKYLVPMTEPLTEDLRSCSFVDRRTGIRCRRRWRCVGSTAAMFCDTHLRNLRQLELQFLFEQKLSDPGVISSEMRSDDEAALAGDDDELLDELPKCRMPSHCDLRDAASQMAVSTHPLLTATVLTEEEVVSVTLALLEKKLAALQTYRAAAAERARQKVESYSQEIRQESGKMVARTATERMLMEAHRARLRFRSWIHSRESKLLQSNAAKSDHRPLVSDDQSDVPLSKLCCFVHLLEANEALEEGSANQSLRCTNLALPSSTYCAQHVVEDAAQRMFDACLECGAPAWDFEDGDHYCFAHISKKTWRIVEAIGDTSEVATEFSNTEHSEALSASASHVSFADDEVSMECSLREPPRESTAAEEEVTAHVQGDKRQQPKANDTVEVNSGVPSSVKLVEVNESEKDVFDWAAFYGNQNEPMKHVVIDETEEGSEESESSQLTNVRRLNSPSPTASIASRADEMMPGSSGASTISLTVSRRGRGGRRKAVNPHLESCARTRIFDKEVFEASGCKQKSQKKGRNSSGYPCDSMVADSAGAIEDAIPCGDGLRRTPSSGGTAQASQTRTQGQRGRPREVKRSVGVPKSVKTGDHSSLSELSDTSMERHTVYRTSSLYPRPQRTSLSMNSAMKPPGTSLSSVREPREPSVTFSTSSGSSRDLLNPMSISLAPSPPPSSPAPSSPYPSQSTVQPYPPQSSITGVTASPRGNMGPLRGRARLTTPARVVPVTPSQESPRYAPYAPSGLTSSRAHLSGIRRPAIVYGPQITPIPYRSDYHERSRAPQRGLFDEVYRQRVPASRQYPFTECTRLLPVNEPPPAFLPSSRDSVGFAPATRISRNVSRGCRAGPEIRGLPLSRGPTLYPQTFESAEAAAAVASIAALADPSSSERNESPVSDSQTFESTPVSVSPLPPVATSTNPQIHTSVDRAQDVVISTTEARRETTTKEVVDDGSRPRVLDDSSTSFCSTSSSLKREIAPQEKEENWSRSATVKETDYGGGAGTTLSRQSSVDSSEEDGLAVLAMAAASHAAVRESTANCIPAANPGAPDADPSTQAIPSDDLQRKEEVVVPHPSAPDSGTAVEKPSSSYSKLSGYQGLGFEEEDEDDD